MTLATFFSALPFAIFPLSGVTIENTIFFFFFSSGKLGTFIYGDNVFGINIDFVSFNLYLS